MVDKLNRPAFEATQKETKKINRQDAKSADFLLPSEGRRIEDEG